MDPTGRTSGRVGGLPADLAAYMDSIYAEHQDIDTALANGELDPGNLLDFLNWVFSLGPNLVASAIDEDYEFDADRSYATYLVEKGVPWGAAGVLGTLFDFLEPGPGELKAAAGGLSGAAVAMADEIPRLIQNVTPALGAVPGLPRAFQKLMGDRLPKELLDEDGLPLVQFHGSGTGEVFDRPIMTENREGHGHWGFFTTPDSAYARETYGNRYNDNPSAIVGAETILGYLQLLTNPSIVGNRNDTVRRLFTQASDGSWHINIEGFDSLPQTLQDSIRDIEGMLNDADPAFRAKAEGWFDVPVPEMVYNSTGFGFGAPITGSSMSDFHLGLGYDGHIDALEEVASYLPESPVEISDIPRMIGWLLDQGVAPDTIRESLNSPITTIPEALDAQRRTLEQGWGRPMEGYRRTESDVSMHAVVNPYGRAATDMGYRYNEVPDNPFLGQHDIQLIDDILTRFEANDPSWREVIENSPNILQRTADNLVASYKAGEPPFVPGTEPLLRVLSGDSNALDGFDMQLGSGKTPLYEELINRIVAERPELNVIAYEDSRGVMRTAIGDDETLKNLLHRAALNGWYHTVVHQATPITGRTF